MVSTIGSVSACSSSGWSVSSSGRLVGSLVGTSVGISVVSVTGGSGFGSEAGCCTTGVSLSCSDGGAASQSPVFC